MKIYRVTYEYPFSGDVFDSHYFSNKTAAMRYAKQSVNELKDIAVSSGIVVVSAYKPGDDGEFVFEREIETFIL